MSSIGKFTTAAVGVTSELTVAAAAFNIDFSLLKVEAPPEYHGLRDVLSHHRLKEAEDGHPHMIARRLGALFESLVPPIPNLIKAYGSRVSEISSSIQDSSHYTPDTGMFGPHGGPNGTSIWAAATSGKGALAVHLLACMLARIWTGTQAISLWAEIVERRKQEIMSDFQTSNSSELSSVMASQQIFSRKDLAIWDGSARSWIQTADGAKRLQHTQLTLVMNNLRMPVNSIRDPYQSVVKAWTSSMAAMELISQGIPQRVQDGGILLAISSWHLYPDMEVLVDEVKTIYQKDHLMKNALITLSAQGIGHKDGVFWSLPLSKMLFYSPPVPSEGRIASDNSRVTMKEFHVVLLGYFIGIWDDQLTINQSCEIIRFIHRRLAKLNPERRWRLATQWFEILAVASEKYLDADDTDRLHVGRLLNLGVRRSRASTESNEAKKPAFLPVPDTLRNKFSFSALMPCLSQSEDSIRLCRTLAQGLPGDGEDIFIKYKLPIKAEEMYGQIFKNIYCFASAKKLKQTPLKGGAQGDDDETLVTYTHYRYATSDRPNDLCVHKESEYDCAACAGCQNKFIRKETEIEGEQFSFLSTADWKIDKICGDLLSFSFVKLHRRSPTPRSGFDSLGTKSVLFPVKPEFNKELLKPTRALPHFIPREHPEDNDLHSPTFEQIAHILNSKALGAAQLCRFVEKWWTSTSIFEQAIYSLSLANTLYSSLHGATISLSVLQLNFSQCHWVNAGYFTRPQYQTGRVTTQGIQLSNLLSCIAMFESGEFDIDPRSLQGVMALSVGDSIYVASCLLADPSETVSSSQPRVKRVLGSLGRSDLAFLTPPANPILRPYDPSSWNVVNHLPFDGKFGDSFSGTTLHLSLTDYELPVDVGSRGLRDTQVVLLEAVVSVIDRGVHIGDLDICSLFSDSTNAAESPAEYLTVQATCLCAGETDRVAQPAQDGDQASLVSLDCWDEVLDPPRSTGVFRACGNWQARLAGAAVSVQQRKQTLVLPRNACLRCITLSNFSKRYNTIVV